MKDFYKLYKRLRRRLLPIDLDIHFRLFFCIIPVRTRLSVLQQSHPEIILCTPKYCAEDESYRHLLSLVYFSRACNSLYLDRPGSQAFRPRHNTYRLCCSSNLLQTECPYPIFSTPVLCYGAAEAIENVLKSYQHTISAPSTAPRGRWHDH